MAATKKATAKKATAKKAAGSPRKTAAAPRATRARRAAESAPDVTVERIRAAERAGQLAVIKTGKLTEAQRATLEKALEKRVEVNLAATKGKPILSMAGSDPAVIKLEADLRRRAPEPRADSGSVTEQSPSASSTQPEEEE